jgi:transcriptional regulator with XRE-family HTH domain
VLQTGEQSFGDFIRLKRESLGMSRRGLAAEIEITPVYLGDIEKGNRSAPIKYLEKLITALNITSQEEIYKFYDLAGKNRQNDFHDINQYIGNTDMARVALRVARDNNVSNDEWQQIINRIKKKHE